jgi:dCTP deaminase
VLKPDSWILKFGICGGIAPFEEAQVNPASYDVRLDDTWVLPTGPDGKNLQLKQNELTLYPGQVVLASTLEYVELPNDVCADLKLKSTIGRSWITHALAGWIDCGFQGQITLELQNIGPKPVVLTKGMRIGQLVFIQMEKAATNPYKGKYQGQKGATEPK